LLSFLIKHYVKSKRQQEAMLGDDLRSNQKISERLMNQFS